MRPIRKRTNALRRATVLLALGLTSVITSAACGSAPQPPATSTTSTAAWEDVVAAAKKEGEVNFYTTTSQGLLDKMAPAFEAKYGIKLNVNRIGQTTDMIERLENEIASNSYRPDVVNHIDERHVKDLIARGYVDTKPNVPSGAAWPKEYYQDGVGQVQLTVYTILYNTKLVPEAEAPRDWEDLLDPRWKGKIGALNPFQPGYAGGYKMLLDKYGKDYLKDFAAQKVKWWDSGNPLAEAVAAGEIPIAVFTYMHKSSLLKKSGAPVNWVELKNTAAYENFVWATAAGRAPHPNAARVFLDWLLSPEGQLSYLGGEGGTSVLDLEGTIPRPENVVVPGIQELDENLNGIRGLLGLKPV
ncbi:extracellular solute-binding protein [Dactylosporangium sp. NPDC051484]|uniref:extracellular solute-binding protein n=1 Tax=Dactylosporangium sp. NPDC051484 TaxID=3154942 RepID=UPI00344F69AD